MDKLWWRWRGLTDAFKYLCSLCSNFTEIYFGSQDENTWKTTKISVWICERSATAAPMFTLIYDLTIQ